MKEKGKPKQKRFKIMLYGMARVKGELYLMGKDRQDAIDEASERVGDVPWHYIEIEKVLEDETEVIEL